MFERTAKIQPEVSKQIIADIDSGFIAQASLFYGEEFRGKMSAALELASALTGLTTEEILKNQSVAVITSRNTKLRLDAAFALWEKYSNSFFRHNVIKEIRLFLSQFQDAVSVLSKKDMDAFRLDKIGELLNEIEIDRDYPSDDVKKYVKELKGFLSPAVSKSQKGSSLTIEQIRLIQNWLSMNDGRSKKIVVLENIEDISVGAKNSLLKLLEEPPENAYIILISNNPNKLLDTILSRVRKYEFKALDKACVSEILRDKYYSSGDDFYTYFLSVAYGEEFSKLEKMAACYSSALIKKENMDVEALNEIVDFLDRYQTYNYFYTLVSNNISSSAFKEEITLKVAKSILDIINNCISIGQIYNQNVHNILDNIWRECM